MQVKSIGSSPSQATSRILPTPPGIGGLTIRYI